MLGLEGPSENNHSNVPPTATSPLLNSEEAAASITPHLTRIKYKWSNPLLAIMEKLHYRFVAIILNLDSINKALANGFKLQTTTRLS
jgi:hypothetical protein